MQETYTCLAKIGEIDVTLKVLSFFLKTPISAEWKPKIRFGGGGSGFTGPTVSKNNKFHLWLDSHQPGLFYENFIHK